MSYMEGNPSREQPGGGVGEGENVYVKDIDLSERAARLGRLEMAT